jgi:hypothetical protein
MEHARTLVEDLLSGNHPAEIRDQVREVELPAIVLLAALKALVLSDQRTDAIDAALGRYAPGEPPRDELAAASAASLTNGYVLRQDHIPVRAHYNLACYYTALARYALDAADMSKLHTVALAHLDYGLEDGTYVQWAQEDPSLRPLEDAKKKQFAAAIKRHTPEQAGQESAEGPAAETGRRHRDVRRRLQRTFVKWLDARGEGGPVGVPSGGLNFEAIVSRSSGDMLIDASAAKEPSEQGLQLFITSTADWPRPGFVRAFLVQRSARLSSTFIELAKANTVSVYAVAGDTVDELSPGGP